MNAFKREDLIAKSYVKPTAAVDRESHPLFFSFLFNYIISCWLLLPMKERGYNVARSSSQANFMTRQPSYRSSNTRNMTFTFPPFAKDHTSARCPPRLPKAPSTYTDVDFYSAASALTHDLVRILSDQHTANCSPSLRSHA